MPVRRIPQRKAADVAPPVPELFRCEHCGGKASDPAGHLGCQNRFKAGVRPY
jgi:hypothetical protein